MATKKNKTVAELRAELAAQKAQADETRKALRAAERREAKERAAAKAAADRRLADALLADVRDALGDDATDDALRREVAGMLARWRAEHPAGAMPETARERGDGCAEA